MNMLCLMLLTLRHVYSGGAKPKILDISYWLVPSSRDSDVHLGQCFLVFPAVWFGSAALSWDHWNQNSELEQYYQKPQGSHWHIPKSRETICGVAQSWTRLKRLSSSSSFQNHEKIHFCCLKSSSVWQLVDTLEIWSGNPLQYSCLGNPMDRGVYGVSKSQMWLNN